MIGVSVVNYNTADDTLACVRSLLDQREVCLRILVLDNGSATPDRERLRSGIDAMGPTVECLCNPENVGFAGGSNLALERLLADPDIEAVLLFNSDATATPDMVTLMAAALDKDRPIDMVAGRMMKFADRGVVDSLGITLYASGLASNRKSIADKLLGPTGGCALFSRRLLEDVLASHGHWFDAAFFCYAEDTDLAMRARLLGYRAAFVDEAIAFHKGSLSSGGGFNDFVLYHGIRNSLFTMAKNLHWSVLLAVAPLAVVLHVGILLRHTWGGSGGTVLRLYRDFARGLPAMLGKRRVIQRNRRIPLREVFGLISPRLYERGYLRHAASELFRGAPPTPPAG